MPEFSVDGGRVTATVEGGAWRSAVVQPDGMWLLKRGPKPRREFLVRSQPVKLDKAAEYIAEHLGPDADLQSVVRQMFEMTMEQADG